MIIKLVKNDTLPKLQFTCQDEDGTALNLTGATVKFIMKKIGATTAKFKSTCTVIDAENGICEYTFDTNNLNESGNFEGEIEVTFSGGGIQTSELLQFEVRNELG